MMRQKIEDKINKIREEFSERELWPFRDCIGGEDYLITNGWTDRYETPLGIKPDNLIEGKCTIYESDKIKGTRITIVDKGTGAIIRETK